MQKKTKARREFLLFVCLVTSSALPSLGQQAGQYVPGQYGLNAGLGMLPDPGFTYANLTVNHSADSLKDSNGRAVPVSGTFSFWSVENIFMYAPENTILGGKIVSMAALNTANASLTADITPTQFGISGRGEGISDTWVQPATLGWHLKRFDTWVGYAFVAPTGTFVPLSSNNNGSGYWGNHFVTGTTFYVAKNKGTQLDLATDWESHGQKKGTNITPGQAFSDEWGLGQILPLKKDLSRLLQLGVIGYDQWQVSANQGITSLLPYYSRHAIGFQTNFILPVKAFTAFFKYEPEYLAKATVQGRTIAFGFAWTLRDPPAQVPKQ